MSQYAGGGRNSDGSMAGAGTSNNAASTSGGGWANAGGSSNYAKGTKASTKSSRAKASKAKQSAKAKTSTKSLGEGLKSTWSSLKSGFKDAKDAIGGFGSAFETALSPTISMHSYKDGGSREQISPRNYRSAQLGMFNKMQQRSDSGALTGYANNVLADYDSGRYTRAGLDALGSLTFGFMPTKIAGKIAGTIASDNAMGGFGFSQGFNLGGLSKKGAGVGGSVGTALGLMSGNPTAMQALSTLGFVGGGYLGNPANANAHQQALGALTANGHSTPQTPHPALGSNGGNGNGNGNGNGGNNAISDTPTTAIDPESNSAFDWSQWSHLYNADTVRRALVAKKTPSKLGTFPRDYYV